jgi:uncharacterized protein YdeI (YjbR/CyaY-like superfamily)
MTEIIACRDGAEWERWLADHHRLQAGVWLKIAKKGSGLASVTNSEALDVALCYGWINGQRKPLDGDWYLQKYTPRRPRSTWSKVNVQKAEALIAAGRMREPGMAEIVAAEADGRWEPPTNRPGAPPCRRTSRPRWNGTSGPGAATRRWAGRTGTS